MLAAAGQLFFHLDGYRERNDAATIRVVRLLDTLRCVVAMHSVGRMSRFSERYGVI
jgi:hypothetical protein